jgi:3-isopropylmalate dehydrogenase
MCVAQAQHGSAPDIAGQGKANPTSLILSAGMLLDWLAEKRGREDLAHAARVLETAVDGALADRETRTADLGGPLSTAEFAKVLADAVAA